MSLQGYSDSALAFGLDGLGYYNNTIIGVYNNAPDRSAHAVVQYTLDNSGTKILSEKILDKGHQLFYEPTTLSIAGNHMYVLANSHLAVYNANKQSTLGVEGKLTPVAIFSIIGKTGYRIYPLCCGCFRIFATSG